MAEADTEHRIILVAFYRIYSCAVLMPNRYTDISRQDTWVLAGLNLCHMDSDNMSDECPNRQAGDDLRRYGNSCHPTF
jgi:hypothetical protein